MSNLSWSEYGAYKFNGNDVIPKDRKAIFGFEPQFTGKRELEALFGEAKAERDDKSGLF